MLNIFSDNFKKWSWSLRIIRSGCLWESSWNSIWLGNKMATFKVVAYGMEVVALMRSGHYERVEWVYILSTLLGSFILTWTIHEVYCHLKMMNFSVDVLVYHVLVLFQKKKKKEKEASTKVWGSRAPQFSPIATCISNATGCLLAG